ncbi:prenyltransferase/squalene oxidase repeat-containing protein [Alienimonas californiensis]|uniref:Prenyltransferase and squalene oxidase repeat protein n=1 Tax=Alienimonas californiensis TaxID=2527989 RepID=A0A517P547_9PLAN|nr:prenyltransferase/squalene oxidase repeat-containing protein [Alienimonas californiensis]QDT14499.1 Prenyltransferase and squalene oxidase repeat protein [Alienimonas californiensis]
MASLSPERRARHRDFLLSQRTPDGGFRGRDLENEGLPGDLYYTGFAVRALAVLGAFEEPIAADVARFLSRHDPLRLGAIDLVSWLYSAVVVQAAGGGDPLADAPSDWPERLASGLEANRSADGGYAKTPAGAAGSTYTSFLVALTLELIGRDVPAPGRLAQFLFDMQRDDGGFVELAPVRRSGTNPTAAAAVLLKLLGHADDELKTDLRGFLTEVTDPAGGVRANTRIPFPDGLSTFTALLMCRDLGLPDPLPAAAMRRWAETELELPTGGFRGAAWDVNADAEYTFYGLGVLALAATDDSGSAVEIA